MRNRGPRHFRLKVEFLLAIVASFIIASFCMYWISSAIEAVTYDAQEKAYQAINEKVNKISEELEVFINEKSIGIDNEDLLQEKIKTYKDVKINAQVLSKNEIEALLEGNYEIWPSYQNRFIITDDHIITLSIQLKGKDAYYNIIGFIYLGAFIILFVIVLSYFISRKQRYLRKIVNGLDILEGGKLDHQVPIKGNDEITDVARHINKMSQALMSRIEKEKLIEQSKNQLIANISHDLRTPLTSITGYLTLLKGDYDSKGDINPQYLDICLNKSTALGYLIEQLFEYVMLSNRQMLLQSVPMNVSTYLQQTCYEWTSLLEEHGLNLEFQVGECHEQYLIDPDKFNRVIENLFKNILKYANPDKKVNMMTYNYLRGYRIELTNGIREGVELSDEDIFNRFFTSDRTMESAGIGLAICKEIIDMHEGDINANVDQDQFTIMIDLYPSPGNVINL